MSLQPDGTAAREGVRIRHYIVSLRYRNPGKAFRIPTSVELAKMFGVARSTVTLELKALTEDGIIIGKRGVAPGTAGSAPSPILRSNTFFPKRNTLLL